MFNETVEEGKAPKIINGEQVYDRVKHLIAMQKGRKIKVIRIMWKKLSIFFSSFLLKKFICKIPS